MKRGLLPQRRNDAKENQNACEVLSDEKVIGLENPSYFATLRLCAFATLRLCAFAPLRESSLLCPPGQPGDGVSEFAEIDGFREMQLVTRVDRLRFFDGAGVAC